jgi:hypothetical protein
LRPVADKIEVPALHRLMEVKNTIGTVVSVGMGGIAISMLDAACVIITGSATTVRLRLSSRSEI